MCKYRCNNFAYRRNFLHSLAASLQTEVKFLHTDETSLHRKKTSEYDHTIPQSHTADQLTPR